MEFCWDFSKEWAASRSQMSAARVRVSRHSSARSGAISSSATIAPWRSSRSALRASVLRLFLTMLVDASAPMVAITSMPRRGRSVKVSRSHASPWASRTRPARLTARRRHSALVDLLSSSSTTSGARAASVASQALARIAGSFFSRCFASKWRASRLSPTTSTFSTAVFREGRNSASSRL